MNKEKLLVLVPSPSAKHFLGLASNLGDHKYYPTRTGHVNQGERNIVFSAPDDYFIMKEVQDTHNPDGNEVDSKLILPVVEDILQHATINAAIDTNTYQSVVAHDKGQGKSQEISTDVMMLFKCKDGVDRHSIALSLFRQVGNYHWDAKLTLILAAFALNYGDFWLQACCYASIDEAKVVALLRRIPSSTTFSTHSKPNFDALNKDIQSFLELNKCIIQFKDLTSMHVSFEVLDRALSKVPTAVYWNVRGMVDCVAQIASFTKRHWHLKLSTEIESPELSSSVYKISHLLEFFKNQLEECHRIKGERKEMEFRNSFTQLYDTIHIDNMKILKILLNSRDNPLPLFDGSTKKKVSLEVLRKRNVLLLISRLDLSPDELSILEQIYSESRFQGSRMDALYNLVWVPIVDPYIDYTDAMHTQFEDMKNSMPWYSVSHPSNIDRAVKKSIGDRWHFRNKPIVVVIDPQGRELSPNALHMMWIWGSTAFPFTISREEALWRDETWRLELLVDGMDPTILNWVSSPI
ncbi:putative sieve element occlusion [Helianthus anomalus]